MREISDELLMAAVAAGDPDAAETLVRRFQPRVYGLALSVVADRGLAEEVAQEAFTRAWLKAAVYDPRRGRVSSWLLTITRNLAVDAARIRRDQPVDPQRLLQTLMAAERPDPPGAVEGALKEGLRSLPQVQSRAIVLSSCYGLTAKEVADREGVPLGTAKSRIRRGLARLRDLLGDPETEVRAGRRAWVPGRAAHRPGCER